MGAKGGGAWGGKGGGKGPKGHESQPNGNQFNGGSWKEGKQLGAEKVELGVMNQREVRGKREGAGRQGRHVLV